MFGLFKKRVDEEQIFNRGLFLFHFDKIFDGTNVQVNNKLLEEKIGVFSATLASLVTDNAKGEGSELTSYERAATIVIFVETVLAVSGFVKFTDQNILGDVFVSGMHRLICNNFKNPSPQEHADMALATMSHKMLCQNDQETIFRIRENALEWLYHRQDKHLDNLAGVWHKIVSTLATQ